MTTVDGVNAAIKHVWTEPKFVAETNGLPDADWWEPRYDQPWRRQMVRDYGAGYLPSREPVVRPPAWYPLDIRDEIAAHSAGGWTDRRLGNAA